MVQIGALDTTAKLFFRNPAHFADLFNFKLFDGRQVIDPKQLVERDTTEIFSLRRSGWQDVLNGAGARSRVSRQRIRDNARAWILNSMRDDTSLYVVLGIENQAKVHYAMPARCMALDSMNYDRQLDEFRKSYRGMEKSKAPVSMTPAERLSGLRRRDRIMPVITLVLYFGADPWDGPVSLHNMLGVQDPDLLALVPDYAINLVQPADMADTDFPKFHTELGQIMNYIHYSKDMDKIHEITHTDDRFRELSPESADLINLATGSRLNIPKKERKEGKVNMCKAIDDMRKVSKAEGLAEGKAAGLAEGDFTARAECVQNVMKSFGVSMTQAMDVLKVDPQQRKALARYLKRHRF